VATDFKFYAPKDPHLLAAGMQWLCIQLSGFQIIFAVHFIHSLIYLRVHSMDPYMARKPVDIEIVNDKQDKSHQ
jgi:hypothetical protein